MLLQAGLGFFGSPTFRVCPGDSGDCSGYSEDDIQAAGRIQVQVTLVFSL